MNNRKTALLETLNAFVDQRPGLDPRDYGCGMEGYRAYRRESAAITRDMHDYYKIFRRVAMRDSITADDIIKASERAFSGRLTFSFSVTCANDNGERVKASTKERDYQESLQYIKTIDASRLPEIVINIDYCAGQYMPTEYRKAATAVLAAAWWNSTREDCPDFPVDDRGDFINSNPGEWMRNQCRLAFGSSMQRKWFN